MILDVDDIVPEETALIIELPTGIKYTAQTGGMSCNHPECEGILLALPTFLQNFDDCSYGCSNLYLMPESKLKLADDLDKYFIENRLVYLRIDRSKMKELDEGWWPVIYNKSIGGTPGPFKGYIHTGNCD